MTSAIDFTRSKDVKICAEEPRERQLLGQLDQCKVTTVTNSVKNPVDDRLFFCVAKALIKSPIVMTVGEISRVRRIAVRDASPQVKITSLVLFSI